MSMEERIRVSYSQGRAKITLPATMKVPGRQRKRIPIVLDISMDQADALIQALKFNPAWVGDGFTHYDWPADEKKKAKAK